MTTDKPKLSLRQRSNIIWQHLFGRH